MSAAATTSEKRVEWDEITKFIIEAKIGIGGASPPIEGKVPFKEDGDIIAIGGYIGDATPETVIDAAVIAERGVAFVVGVWWVVLGEIAKELQYQRLFQDHLFVGGRRLWWWGDGVGREKTYVATALFW